MISKNAVIAFLVFTAMVLSCILVLQNLVAPPAARAAATSRAGRYAIVTTMVDANADLLWIANVDTQLLSVYTVDRNGFIRELDSIDLIMIFGTSGFAQMPTQPPTRPRPQPQVTPPAEPEQTEETPTPARPSRRPPRTRPPE